ncbi:FAD dependent oxidoreductase [Dentipellis sp. KUC8613]|nr:FAD dependent oxidoreductase [Dentipellis sp. KUC8613]
MGNLLSRARLALKALLELNAEYKTVEARLKRSPGLPVAHPTMSFWTVPPAPIANHRPEVLPSHADVVIVGSGITGAAAAWTLLAYAVSRPLTVIMLEARETCSGATGRNGGHINPPLFHDYSELKEAHGVEDAQKIIRLRLAHLGELMQVADEVGAREHSQIREVESLDVFYDLGTFEHEKRALEAWRADMPEEAHGVYALDGSQAIEKFQLATQTRGCIVTPAGAAHPYRLVTSVLSTLLKKHHDRFYLSTRTPVTAITPPAESPYYSVQTPRGLLTTPHIIHATNGWSGHLLAPLRMKILPVRGLMSAQRPGTSMESAMRSGGRAHIFNSGPLGYDYLTQLPTGEHELMFGGGAAQAGRAILPEVGETDDGGYNMGIAAHVAGALPEYFGRDNWGQEGVPPTGGSSEVQWAAGRVKALWTGVLGISADGLPWVGRLPEKVAGRSAPQRRAAPAARAAQGSSSQCSEKAGAPRSADAEDEPLTAAPGEWISAGYSGEGMVHAWMSGRAVATMLLGAEREGRLNEWFPDVFRVSENRWKRATLERLMDRL